jgi:hypothetical protein
MPLQAVSANFIKKIGSDYRPFSKKEFFQEPFHRQRNNIWFGKKNENLANLLTTTFDRGLFVIFLVVGTLVRNEE